VNDLLTRLARDRRVVPGLYRPIKLPMPWSYRPVTYRVPDVVRRPDGLRPCLCVRRPGSCRLGSCDADRPAHRDGPEPLYVLGERSEALARHEAALRHLLNLFRGLSWKRLDQVDLKVLKILVGLPCQRVLQAFSCFCREFSTHQLPRFEVGRSGPLEHDSRYLVRPGVDLARV